MDGAFSINLDYQWSGTSACRSGMDRWMLLSRSAINDLGVSVSSQSQDGRFEVRGRHGKSLLTITGVRLTDLGRFDCEALSRIGGHQKSMFLDIECKFTPLVPCPG